MPSLARLAVNLTIRGSFSSPGCCLPSQASLRVLLTHSTYRGRRRSWLYFSSLGKKNSPPPSFLVDPSNRFILQFTEPRYLTTDFFFPRLRTLARVNQGPQSTDIPWVACTSPQVVHPNLSINITNNPTEQSQSRLIATHIAEDGNHGKGWESMSLKSPPIFPSLP